MLSRFGKPSNEIVSVRLDVNKTKVRFDTKRLDGLSAMRSGRSKDTSTQTELEEIGYILADITKAAVNSLREAHRNKAYDNLSNTQIETKIVETFLDEMCLDL